MRLYGVTDVDDYGLEFIKTISSEYQDLTKFNQNIWYTDSQTIGIYDLELPMLNHPTAWHMYKGIIKVERIYKVNDKYVYPFDMIVAPTIGEFGELTLHYSNGNIIKDEFIKVGWWEIIYYENISFR